MTKKLTLLALAIGLCFNTALPKTPITDEQRIQFIEDSMTRIFDHLLKATEKLIYSEKLQNLVKQCLQTGSQKQLKNIASKTWQMRLLVKTGTAVLPIIVKSQTSKTLKQIQEMAPEQVEVYEENLIIHLDNMLKSPSLDLKKCGSFNFKDLLIYEKENNFTTQEPATEKQVESAQKELTKYVLQLLKTLKKGVSLLKSNGIIKEMLKKSSSETLKEIHQKIRKIEHKTKKEALIFLEQIESIIPTSIIQDEPEQ